MTKLFGRAREVVGMKNPGGQISDYNTVATAGGDSGGALYNVKGEIMGTVSSGVELPQFPDNVISIFTNIHAGKTRTFLEPIITKLETKSAPPKMKSTPAIEAASLPEMTTKDAADAPAPSRDCGS